MDTGPKLTFSSRPDVRSLSDPMINKKSSVERTSKYLDRLKYAKKVEGRISRNADNSGNENSNSASRINSADASRKVSGAENANTKFNNK